MRLKEEEHRIQLYFHESVVKCVVRLCENILIKPHLDTLYGEFENLLIKDIAEGELSFCIKFISILQCQLHKKF